MTYSDATIWFIILALGVGTYLIRLSFLGLVGDREMPDWVLRHLRYTPVAVLPGLVAPLVIWPDATGGEPDPVRLAAATVTMVAAWWSKNAIWGFVAGAATFGGLTALA